MTTTLSQNPMDYYNKQMLGQNAQVYGMPTSPFAEQFSQFGSDLWLQQHAQQQQTPQKNFFVSPEAIMPRTTSESPSIMPLDLDTATNFGDSLSDSMFQSSPVDGPTMMFQQFPSATTPPQQNPYDFLASPTFSVHSPLGHRKTASDASSSGSLRSSTSPPPPPPPPPVTTTTTTTTTASRATRSSATTQRGGSSLVSGRRTTLPPKKTTHNMIEKRYRNNLNDKIAALRDAIPAMRVMVQRLENQVLTGGELQEEEDEEDLDGLAPANKVNKATILSKATEYIAHLEAKNKALATENTELKTKVSGLEMIVMGVSEASEPSWN